MLAHLGLGSHDLKSAHAVGEPNLSQRLERWNERLQHMRVGGSLRHIEGAVQVILKCFR